MPFDPEYGEMPVSDEDLEALLPSVRDTFEDAAGVVSKADIYDLEQAIQATVIENLTQDILDGQLSVNDLLNNHFIRELHKRLYGDVWAWAGVFRKREVSLGIDPFQIPTEMRSRPIGSGEVTVPKPARDGYGVGCRGDHIPAHDPG